MQIRIRHANILIKGDIHMSDNNTRITPVGLGAAAIVGGAAGILAKQGYEYAKTTLHERPDSFVGSSAKAARDIKNSLKDFFKSPAMKKVGAFCKHPVTIGVAAGVIIYTAVKKFFAPLFPIFLISVNAPAVSSFL